MPKKKLVLFPYNGNAIEAVDCINDDEFELIGFIDDNANKKTANHTLFSREILLQHKDLYLLAVPGSPSSFLKRTSIIQSLNVDEKRFVSLIHPTASIGKTVRIGYNCLVMAGVVITSNAILSNHVCILPNSVIHHDSVVGEYTLIGSNVIGNVADNAKMVGNPARDLNSHSL